MLISPETEAKVHQARLDSTIVCCKVDQRSITRMDVKRACWARIGGMARCLVGQSAVLVRPSINHRRTDAAVDRGKVITVMGD